MKLAAHLERVAKRGKAFYRQSTPGHFLVATYLPYEYIAVPPLNSYDLDRQLPEYLEHRLQAARPGWQVKEGLDDDVISSICPHFGIAEHSAWLGLDVRFQETTSLPIPSIKTPGDLSRLQLSEENKWFQYMKTAYEYLRSRQDGTFVLSVRGTMAPMDVANAVRGDELYTDVLLEPDFCHELMRRLVEAIDWYYSRLRSWATEIHGGYMFAFGGWMPSGAIGHLSNDAALLCSPQVYEQFGYPYESALVERYDHVLYHVHNEQMHFVPLLATLPHLAMLEVTRDPKTVPTIEDLERIFEATGSANLMLNADSDQVRQHIDEMKHRNIFIRASCKDRADAEDIIAFVRDRSEPLD